MSKAISLVAGDVLLSLGIQHLVDGDLAESGIQWSSEVSTVNADTDYVAFEKALDNGQSGDIFEIVLGLTLAIKAGSTTADVKYKWQAKSKNSTTWVDLHGYITKADIGTAYKEFTISGCKFPVTDFNAYPIDIRLVIQSNEVSPGIATAKVKNSSFVEVELR